MGKLGDIAAIMGLGIVGFVVYMFAVGKWKLPFGLPEVFTGVPEEKIPPLTEEAVVEAKMPLIDVAGYMAMRETVVEPITTRAFSPSFPALLGLTVVKFMPWIPLPTVPEFSESPSPMVDLRRKWGR